MIHRDCQKEAENLEKEAKYTIITMDEDSSECEDKKLLDDAKKEITRLYNEFRNWLAENVNSDESGERMERLKQETHNLILRTKISLQNIHAREDVKAGKEKVVEAGTFVKDKVSDGIHEVVRNEYVSKVVDGVNETIDSVVYDERVQRSVKKLKKGTLKVAESAFNELKRVLDTDDQDK